MNRRDTIAADKWRVQVRRLELLNGVSQPGLIVAERLFGSVASAEAYYSSFADADDWLAKGYCVSLEHRKAGKYRYRLLRNRGRYLQP